MAIRQHLLAGHVICLIASLSVFLQQEPALDDLFPSNAEAKAAADNIAAAWKMVRDMPADIYKADIEISKSRYDVGNFDIFTDRDIAFKATIDLPENRSGIVRKISGALGPCYGSYYISGPPDEKLGTLAFYSKSMEEPLVVIVTNSGFYLGEELDPRLKFHSWYFAKLVNDAAIAQGTSLNQSSFNQLSGASRIVADQWYILKFDKEDYKKRPANIWNFLPE